MKRLLHAAIFSSLLTLLFAFILFPGISIADEVEYFYDNAGRLERVLKGSEGLIYKYDNVGNILSISRGAVGTGAPIINSIKPDVLFIGSKTLATIQGQNFFTTNEVVSDNPALTINILNVTDTEIMTEITVSPDALNGTSVDVIVMTSFGSASAQATLTSSEIIFIPQHISLMPGSTGDIEAIIVPGVGKDVTIPLYINNPFVATAPSFVTIPSSRSTMFIVDAIKIGKTIIYSGETNVVVYVTDEIFSPLPGEEVVKKTVPVSVYVETPSTGYTSTSSLPVSVYTETSSLTNATVASLPISVHLGEAPFLDTTTTSLPISVYIETPSLSNTTISSLPVSIYLEEPTSDNATVTSLPVSTKIEIP